MVKKIPERKCKGCNEKFPKKELLRIVRTPEGEISIDTVGKQNGRGVYICKNPDCFKKVRKGDKLSQSLDAKVPEAVYEEIAVLLESEGRECTKI